MFSEFLNFFPFSLPKITLNDRTIHVKHDFTWGVNVDNAAHPCVAGPCAHGGSCRPRKEGYDCDCPLGFEGLHCQKGARGRSARGRAVDRPVADRRRVKPGQPNRFFSSVISLM